MLSQILLNFLIASPSSRRKPLVIHHADESLRALKEKI
jgi:hypothetical protein